MSNIIEAMISAKEYYDKGENCTLRLHNFTKGRIVTEKVGPSKSFDAATAPPLFIGSDKYGDAIFNASKFFEGILNVFYSVSLNEKLYGIHVNYIWKKQTVGEIKVQVVEGDTLYPEKECWVPLYEAGSLKDRSLPFDIRYMASGSFVEIGIMGK
jgi:hypothetical protein